MAHGNHDHDHGLAFDLAALGERTFNRRSLLRVAIGAGLASFVGCTTSNAGTSANAGTGGNGGSGNAGSGTAGSDSAGSSSGASGSSSSSGSAAGSCAKIPEETAGPYPGDGSNGANALVLAGIVRSDIRSSFAGASGTAEGVPLTVKLKVVDLADGCTPLAGYAVYAWHCDRDGNYSMYSQAVADQNYLRGVQETDDDGVATFQTIFPGCYSGRWPHIHFEVYQSLDAAQDSGNKIATSQIALPQSTCSTVYAESGYETSVANLSRISLASDNVFSDGADQELAAMSGDVSGYVAELSVPVNA